MLNSKALAASVSAGPKIYVEDVFSTWLYTGTGSAQTITNGIDLSGKGGLVWIKGRSDATGHRLTDTAKGATKSLESNSTAAEATESTGVTSFSSTGFAIGADADYSTNAATYASWTFRKAQKFFDVVTYTGNGSNRTISHNLGSVPGCIIVKRTDTTGDWQVYHRSLANTEYMVLNTTAPKATGTTRWNSTTPTSTVFSLGTDATVNANGGTYVAYLFAHNAGGFGDAGTSDVISCGIYTGNGSDSGPTIDLGWEPQWLLIKGASNSGSWHMFDSMRGMYWLDSSYILADSAAADTLWGAGVLNVLPNGFQIKTTTTGAINGNTSTYIYIAIRRGPMKTPTDATKVFNTVLYSGNSTQNRTISGAGFPVDLLIDTYKGYNSNKAYVFDRLRGKGLALYTVSTSGQSNTLGKEGDLTMDGFVVDYTYGFLNNGGSNYAAWTFRRAPGFFDVVAYTGTGSATTVSHNLGVVPELMIVKRRDTDADWQVYAGAAGEYLVLNTTAAKVTSNTDRWNNTAPTSSVFSLGTNAVVNANAGTYVAYLFATVSGVSKVGSYTGSGTTKQIDCGFTNGARFVLIKRTDSTGDWYVWDTARGIVSGNDPYLLLNSTAAEVTNTDYIDPYSAGFEISSTAPAAINANGGSFVFLAVA